MGVLINLASTYFKDTPKIVIKLKNSIVKRPHYLMI
jgi:hypothetical protein